MRIDIYGLRVPGCPWCLGVLGAWVSLVPGCSWCLGVIGAWVSLVPGRLTIQNTTQQHETAGSTIIATLRFIASYGY